MVIKTSTVYIRLYTCYQTIPLCIYRDHHNLMHFFNSNGHITVNNYQNNRLYKKKKHFRFSVHTVTPIDNNFIAKYSAWALSTTTSITAGKNKTKQILGCCNCVHQQFLIQWHLSSTWRNWYMLCDVYHLNNIVMASWARANISKRTVIGKVPLTFHMIDVASLNIQMTNTRTFTMALS